MTGRPRTRHQRRARIRAIRRAMAAQQRRNEHWWREYKRERKELK